MGVIDKEAAVVIFGIITLPMQGHCFVKHCMYCIRMHCIVCILIIKKGDVNRHTGTFLD